MHSNPRKICEWSRSWGRCHVTMWGCGGRRVSSVSGSVSSSVVIDAQGHEIHWFIERSNRYNPSARLGFSWGSTQKDTSDMYSCPVMSESSFNAEAFNQMSFGWKNQAVLFGNRTQSASFQPMYYLFECTLSDLHNPWSEVQRKSLLHDAWFDPVYGIFVSVSTSDFFDPCTQDVLVIVE